MNATIAIMQILLSLPERRIVGRKRLQKLVHLLTVSGVDIDAEFRIHNFGPFSDEVAEAADELVSLGVLRETLEPVGVYRSIQYVYGFDKGAEPNLVPDKEVSSRLEFFNKFSTVELEVASTIAFFEASGASRDTAMGTTVDMKPTKSVAPVLKKANWILDRTKEYVAN